MTRAKRERILDYCSKETRQDCHAVLVPLTVTVTMACFRSTRVKRMYFFGLLDKKKIKEEEEDKKKMCCLFNLETDPGATDIILPVCLPWQLWCIHYLEMLLYKPVPDLFYCDRPISQLPTPARPVSKQLPIPDSDRFISELTQLQTLLCNFCNLILWNEGRHYLTSQCNRSKCFG